MNLEPDQPIDQQQLLAYLSGKLDAASSEAFERSMAENAFLKDAADGLKPVSDNTDLELVVEQLNRHLHRELKQKKSRKGHHVFSFPWVYVAAAVILIVCVVTFVMIRYFLHK